MDERDLRDSAWYEYLEKMRELDAANNFAGRGLIPSHRDWHAGWDAAITALRAKGEPSDAQVIAFIRGYYPLTHAKMQNNWSDNSLGRVRDGLRAALRTVQGWA